MGRTMGLPTREEFTEYCNSKGLTDESVIASTWDMLESELWMVERYDWDSDGAFHTDRHQTKNWKYTALARIRPFLPTKKEEPCASESPMKHEEYRPKRPTREEFDAWSSHITKKYKPYGARIPEEYRDLWFRWTQECPSRDVAQWSTTLGMICAECRRKNSWEKESKECEEYLDDLMEFRNAYHVFTDGSAWYHPFKTGVWCGGSAYIILHGGEVFRQGNYGNTETTINRMEMLAIICGVAHCQDGARIVVHSDSQYSLNVLSGKWKAKVNTDLVEMHKKHSASKGEITYLWVKGHAGNKYNELCDQLANVGRIRAMRDAGLDWKKALETTNRWRASKGESKIVV